MKHKRTFEEWLKIVHGMSIGEYYELNDMQQQALLFEYKGW